MTGRSGADGADRRTGYCTNCGAAVSSTANYCSNCGSSRAGRGRETTARSDATAERQPTDRRTTDRQPSAEGRTAAHRPSAGRAALEDRVATALEAGWEVDRDFGDHVVLVRRDLGGVGAHLLVGLLTLWWTMGIGNGLYALYRYVARAERTVLWEDDAPPAVRGAEEGSSDWSPLAVGFRWFAGALLIALGTSISTPAFAAATIAFGAVIALAGVARLPPVRRRLADRRSITTNGRHRRVDERSVAGGNEPCTCCAGPIGCGAERTYQDAYYVLGIPLSTNAAGSNVYCRACANGEPPADATAERRDRTDERQRIGHDDVTERDRQTEAWSGRRL